MKVFVSYKHMDSGVRPIANPVGTALGAYWEPTTARHYVDILHRQLIRDGNHIYKGEGNEDLSEFKDDTIETKLKEKIFDSTITVILISKNMKNLSLPENDQWIPWEVAYSLREKSRDGRVSNSNGALAVVLPDENNSYEYFIQPTGCSTCGSTSWKTETLFDVLGKNMFNRKQPNTLNCTSGVCGPVVHFGDNHSYIYPIHWDFFIKNVNYYLNLASNLRQKIDEYKVQKIVTSQQINAPSLR